MKHNILKLGEKDIKTSKIIAIMYTLRKLQKIKPEKNVGLNFNRTHDLCSTGAVLCQLSYQVNTGSLGASHGIPVDVCFSFVVAAVAVVVVDVVFCQCRVF